MDLYTQRLPQSSLADRKKTSVHALGSKAYSYPDILVHTSFSASVNGGQSELNREGAPHCIGLHWQFLSCWAVNSSGEMVVKWASHTTAPTFPGTG